MDKRTQMSLAHGELGAAVSAIISQWDWRVRAEYLDEYAEAVEMVRAAEDESRREINHGIDAESAERFPCLPAVAGAQPEPDRWRRTAASAIDRLVESGKRMPTPLMTRVIQHLRRALACR